MGSRACDRMFVAGVAITQWKTQSVPPSVFHWRGKALARHLVDLN